MQGQKCLSRNICRTLYIVMTFHFLNCIDRNCLTWLKYFFKSKWQISESSSICFKVQKKCFNGLSKDCYEHNTQYENFIALESVQLKDVMNEKSWLILPQRSRIFLVTFLTDSFLTDWTFLFSDVLYIGTSFTIL